MEFFFFGVKSLDLQLLVLLRPVDSHLACTWLCFYFTYKTFFSFARCTFLSFVEDIFVKITSKLKPFLFVFKSFIWGTLTLTKSTLKKKP